MDKLEELKRQYKGMHYLYIDSSKEKTLLILHGWMQTKESWLDIIELLKESFNIICPDLPGFGESINDEEFFGFTVEAYASFLYEFLENEKISKVSILGHSYGGRITISMAEKYKDKIDKIVIYASPGMETTNSLYYSLINTFKGISHSSLVSIEPIRRLKEKVKTKIGSRDYKASGKREKLFLNAIGYDVSKHLKNITSKALIIWGENDKELDISQAFSFQKGIKGSKVYVLKSYGHFAHLEAPQLFAKTITKFLNDEKIY